MARKGLLASIVGQPNGIAQLDGNGEVPSAQLPASQGGVEFGTTAGTACEGNDARLSDARTPTAHNHDGVYEPADAAIQTHIGSAHAPSNAQKNSDITKAEIEAKLTGVIASHSHAGGADGDVSLYKSGDQTISAAGFVDISGLTFSVAASKAYAIEAYLVFQSSATTMGVLIGVNGPASPALVSINSRKEITAVATAGTDKFSEAIISAYDTANPASTAEIAANTNLVHQFYGVFVNGSNAGTFAMRLSKENVAGNATIKAGSWLRYRLLN